MGKIYRYVGPGEGIPGLPSIISEDQARQDGTLELLKDAVRIGAYTEVKPSKVLSDKENDNG